MEPVGIRHDDQQEDDRDVKQKANDHKRDHWEVNAGTGDMVIRSRHDDVHLKEESDDIKPNQRRLVKDKPHDEDRGGVADRHPLAFEGIALHDLATGRARGDVGIELPDQRSGEPLVELILPSVEAAEDKDNQPVDAVGKEDQAEDQKEVTPIGGAERLHDFIELAVKGEE